MLTRKPIRSFKDVHAAWLLVPAFVFVAVLGAYFVVDALDRPVAAEPTATTTSPDAGG